MYERQDLFIAFTAGLIVGLIIGALAGSDIVLRAIDGERAPEIMIAQPVDNEVVTLNVKAGKVETGLASWYGEPFHGRTTANMEIYDLSRYTAASRTLKLGSLALVECEETGKRVIVRINDRGPYVHGRIIDLSWAAASKLGIVNKGLTKVRVIPMDILWEKLSGEDGP